MTWPSASGIALHADAPEGRVKELIGLSRSLRVLAFISVVLTPCILAQTGGIQGVVLDSKNKPVNSSHVIASLAPASGAADPKGRNLHTITDKAGAFSFSALPIGAYRICVEAPATDLSTHASGAHR